MARLFDGAGDYLSITDNAAIKPTTAMTMSMWIKAAGSTGEQSWSDKRDFASQGGYQMRMSGAAYPMDARFLTRDSGGAEHPATKAGIIQNGVWHNVVGTFGSSRTDFYVDNSAGTPDTTAALAANTQTMRIGTWKDINNYFFNGDIAEFAIWNRVLSAGEIAALSKGFAPTFFRSGLTFYLPIIGNNSPELDYAAGLSATVTNTTKSAHPRIIYPSNYQIAAFSAGTPPAAGNTEWPRFMSRGFMSPGF